MVPSVSYRDCIVEEPHSSHKNTKSIMSETETEHESTESPQKNLPTWDDEYLEAVSARLCYHYDLEKDHRVEGVTFPLYGEMVIENKKHFLHPAISIANHESYEHLFVQRKPQVTVSDLDHYIEMGHALADDLIEPSEEHYSTEFTFVTVVPTIPEDVHSKVETLDERTMLKYGYHGHYEINLIVVSPDTQELVANETADVTEAFATWEEIEREEPGLLKLIARRFQL